jgi:hypothetical protein
MPAVGGHARQRPLVLRRLVHCHQMRVPAARRTARALTRG